ncbi:hypothetical protein Tco_0427369 [Tanacetum coccineum]
MADENVPTSAPIRYDDQILPFAAWMPIGKSNHVLDLQKRQKNLIFQIAVDILQNTNFFRTFTASASVLAIYIQQLWNTLTYVEKDGIYRFQLDEDWFTLDENLLREALEITPIDQAHSFVSPPLGDAIMGLVNELGFPEVIHYVSSMTVNHLYQPWKAIFTNVDYAKLMWEEFVQAMQTFLTDKVNLGSPTKKGSKDKSYVIPYCRFMKLIICHLGRIHNIHQRSASLFHLAEEDLRLEMVAKHDQKVDAEKEENKKSASNKQPKPKPAIKKSSKPEPAPKPKLVDEPDEEPAYSEPEPELEQEDTGKGKAIVTEEQAAQSLLAMHTPKRRSTTDQFILQRRTLATEEASFGPSAQPLDDISANIIRDSPSHADAKTGARSDKTCSGGDTKIVKITEEQGEDVEK